MLGSVIVEEVIYQRLKQGPAIMGQIGEDNLHGLNELPQDAGVPAILYYAEMSNYGDPPVGVTGIEFEEMDVVVRVVVGGGSLDDAIEPAMEQLELITGMDQVLATFQGDDYTLTFKPLSEFLPTTLREGTRFYRQLGTSYRVTIQRG